MSDNDDPRACYCPFAYGYSNYSRPGYVRYTLQAGGLVDWNGVRLRSTLGGAGLAVSSKTRAPREAMDYAAFSASPEIQKGLYFEAGGQPGHRAAWVDERVNAACNNFFRDTLETLDSALLRPKHPRYMDFQDAATPIAHAAVAGSLAVADAVEQINAIWRKVQ
jgi:multiple sugar transport system substrate-binding protein